MIIIPINTKSKTPFFILVLSHSNGWYWCTSMFIVTMIINFNQSNPSFESTIDCIVTRTPFSNCFYDALAFISPVLIMSQHFFITSVTVVHNYPLSGKNLMLQLKIYIYTRQYSTSKWPIKLTDISSPNTFPNFPEKSIIYFFHHFMFPSFIYGCRSKSMTSMIIKQIFFVSTIKPLLKHIYRDGIYSM